MCLGTLVQDGLAHMCGVIWRAVPAKFKTGMCEMKILGSEVLWCVLGHWFKVGTHVGYNMEIRDLLRQSSKQGSVR